MLYTEAHTCVCDMSMDVGVCQEIVLDEEGQWLVFVVGENKWANSNSLESCHLKIANIWHFPLKTGHSA